MLISERESFVYIVLPGATEFVTAGRFRWRDIDGDSIGEFVYGRSYIERRDAVEIDPVELRLSDRSYETALLQGFFGAIRDAMPDDWGRRVLERRIGSAQLGEFDYLEHGPDDRAGALGFGPAVTPPPASSHFNEILHLEKLQRAADMIVGGEPAPTGRTACEVEDLLLLGTSMGGARPKTQVRHDDVLWIAKFGRHDDRWNNPRVEHGMLQLARACGLTVADSRVETAGGRDVLLIRRFDRQLGAAGLQRHRMVSALTLLRVDERDRDRWSYLSLADEIRRIADFPEKNLKELFARMCFNAAVSNLDDHPRNHAAIASGMRWQLSPAFDLTPFPAIGHERDLAMRCGLFGRRANQDNLLSGHARFMLNKEDAKAVYAQVIATVQGQWRDRMRSAGVHDHDCETIAPAFLPQGLSYKALSQASSFEP